MEALGRLLYKPGGAGHGRWVFTCSSRDYGLLGFPITFDIDINDSEELLPANQTTNDEASLDLVLHIPGGLVLAVLQIAKAVREQKGKVAAFVLHDAMSGGTPIALPRRF